MNKLIITVALTGAEVNKDANPNLPVTPQEIADEAYLCQQAGASIVHLHARDSDQKPTQCKDYFCEIIDRVKEKTDLIIQVSTGGAVGMQPEERLQPVYLKPEMATLTTGSVNFGDGVFLNPPSYIEKFALAIKEGGVKPEIEVFDFGMINNALNLVKKGILELPLHFDFVMGVQGGMPASIRNLIHLADSIPDNCTWTVAGIGRHELPLGTAAILLGGHVRVGFEDNIYFEKGKLADSNAQLAERIALIAGIHNRAVAAPDEARQILGL